MITFYLVLVSARLSEKWKSKTLFSWKKISLPDAQISQNCSSYYQLPFSESNRLIVSVICAWLSIKAISITTKESNTRAAWSKGTEPQAAHRMKPSAWGSLWSDWKVWLKKWPEILNLAHALTFCRSVDLGTTISHGIQNGYYLVYGTRIVSVLLRRTLILVFEYNLPRLYSMEVGIETK